MILVIGGSYQGKTTYAKSAFSLLESDIINGENITETTDLKSYKCLDNFELFIKNSLQNKKDPLEETKKLISENKNLIIISAEVGSGIVPMEKEERDYREAIGKACQLLSSESEKVIRLFCGIAKQIK